MTELDPRTYEIEVDGRRIPLAELAAARDFVRMSHMALDPYKVEDVKITRGKAEAAFSVKGHAAVFNRLSHDLGGFREKIAPGFFKSVLDRDPDVHALWDHDTRWVLARTRNKTLELREDPMGLHNWMQVAPTSWADDLRVLMERGDIDQQSFAFTVENDRWQEKDGQIIRTLVEAKDLFDVTITAQGAYPQTGAQVVRSIRSVLDTDHRVYAVNFESNDLTTPADDEGSSAQATPDAAPDGDVEERDAASEEVNPVDDPDATPHDEVVDDASDPDPEQALRIRELQAKAEMGAVEVEKLKERIGKLS